MTRFTVPGSALAIAAAWATRLNPSRPTAPPLAGVVLDASGEQLTISAYDFDTAGTAVLDAEVVEAGRVLVAGRLLAAVTKTLGAKDTATLEVEGSVLRLSIGKGQGWELPTLDLDLYPQLPVVAPAVAEVDAAELADALARVLPAVSTDPSLPAISGVYISTRQGEGLTLAGTDRYRLGVAEIDWEPLGAAAETGEVEQVLVPAELLGHVVAAARESSGRVRCHIDGASFGISSARRSVTGRLLDSPHLAWQRIALDEDKAQAAVAVVATDELRGAVDRASVMLSDGESLTLQFSADGIVVRPTLGGRGRANHTAEIVSFTGDEQRVGVSGRFLRTAIESLGSPMAEVRFVARDWMPFLMRPADVDGTPIPGYRHVVAQQRQAVVEEKAA